MNGRNAQQVNELIEMFQSDLDKINHMLACKTLRNTKRVQNNVIALRMQIENLKAELEDLR